MCSEFKNSVQIKAVTNLSLFKQYITNIVWKFNRKDSEFVFRQVFLPVKGISYHKETTKNEFAPSEHYANNIAETIT